ncbi:MAG: SPFH domain-containing protein, partial [Oscillospiraceae bacterium]|nr:SPFH domain-containing protein [Oscillospiraceae bacterium]
LQPAFGALAELELRPAQIPAKANELKAAMNEALRAEWVESRGITVEKIALNPITLTDEDMKKIQQMEDAATMGSNPFMMAGRMTDATANAMEAAAANEGGAMNGFIGMGMAGGAMGGGFNAAQNFYNMGAQQMQQSVPNPQVVQAQNEGKNAMGWKCSCGATATGKFCPECGTPKPVKEEWKCGCGAVNTGKFCQNCGASKPENASWRCACGAVNEGKFCPNCGAKKP